MECTSSPQEEELSTPSPQMLEQQGNVERPLGTTTWLFHSVAQDESLTWVAEEPGVLAAVD